MRSSRIPLIGAMRYVASSCLAIASMAASSADLALPNAGSLLQEVKPLPDNTVPKGDSFLRALPPPNTDTPESVHFVVKKFVVTGNSVFETAILYSLIAPEEGKRLSLAQIEKAIGAITQFYQQAGFPLARAIIPVQTIDEGVVTIQVIEGRLGAVSLENNSTVKTAVLNKTLADLWPGMAIRQEFLEDALLSLTDLPGVVATSVLKPGQTVGTADLSIVVQPGAATSVDVTVDNYGSRYTGRERLAANVQLFNPLGLGDVLGLSALNSGTPMNYGRLSYELSFDARGGYFGAAASALQYSLGNTAESLQAQGTAQSGSVWLRKYLVHHQGHSVNLKLQYDPYKLRDDVESSGNHNVRQLELWSLELQAQADNNWFGGGYSSVDLGVCGGNLAFDDAVAKKSDALTAKTQGDFGVTSVRVEHLQRLDRLTSVLIAFSGQWSKGNLDASQKLSLGGARSVRAYESGVLSGDSGQFASLELQRNLAPMWNSNSRWQAVVFVDAGQVQINQNPWTTTNNQAYISGAGMGLNWHGPSNWRARLYAARAISPDPVQLDGAEVTHGNAWIEIGKTF